MANEIVYGIHAVQGMLKQSYKRIKSLKIQIGCLNFKIKTIIDNANQYNLPIDFVEKSVLNQMCSGIHQGVIAMVSTYIALTEKHLEDWCRKIEHSDKKKLILILDGVTDPHNLGACIRTADAASVDVIITPKDNSAKINATVEKVACGATNRIPWFAVTNLSRVIDLLKKYGFWVYGTTGESGNQIIYDIKFDGSLALVMGSEEKGLRRLTKEKCDFLVSIPMAGYVSSLNVSVATGIALFEMVRQRSLA